MSWLVGDFAIHKLSSKCLLNANTKAKFGSPSVIVRSSINSECRIFRESFYRYPCCCLGLSAVTAHVITGIGMDACITPIRHGGLSLVQSTSFFYVLVDDPYMMVRQFLSMQNLIFYLQKHSVFVVTRQHNSCCMWPARVVANCT